MLMGMMLDPRHDIRVDWLVAALQSYQRIS